MQTAIVAASSSSTALLAMPTAVEDDKPEPAKVNPRKRGGGGIISLPLILYRWETRLVVSGADPLGWCPLQRGLLPSRETFLFSYK